MSFMIHLHLNLISPQKKSGLNRLIKFLFTKDILEMVVFVSAIIAIALLWSWLILTEEFTGLSESAVLVNRSYTSYNQEVRAANKTINNLYDSSEGFVPIVPRLLELIKIMPPNVRLAALNLDRRQNELVFSGTAQTRDALINFQNIVKTIPWLEKITCPPSQLFQKEDINFEIKAELKNWPPLRLAPN
jgi:hypothetical protein